MNANALKGKMREMGRTQQEIAAVIGINPSTFNRKLNGTADFLLGEMTTIKTALNLSTEDMGRIFFDE